MTWEGAADIDRGAFPTNFFFLLWIKMSAGQSSALVIHGANGRTLAFSADDLVMPEHYTGKPWHQRQWTSLRPIIMGRMLRGGGGRLATLQLAEVVAEMERIIENRWEERRSARKDYHKRKKGREEVLQEAEDTVMCIFGAGSSDAFATEGASILEDLCRGVESCGPVKSCRWVTVDGTDETFGNVRVDIRFSDSTGVSRAIQQFNGRMFDGRPLLCKRLTDVQL